jgi:tetratricopeptide (TPR) repeat protein
MLSALNDGSVRSKTLLTRLADQPKSPAIIGVAEVLCEQGRYSEAVSRLRGVADLYGDVYRFNLVLARACRDSGETELAKQYYEKACQIAPQNEVAIKELIALTAFPHAASKPSSHTVERERVSQTAPSLSALAPKQQASQTPDIETSSATPSVFKLDREKLSKALGGVIGSSEKKDDATFEVQKPASNTPTAASSVVEEFRKADNLLEQEPDIDALAREMMGNTFLPNKPLDTSQNDVSGTSSTQAPPPQPPKIAKQHQPSTESEADIDAIARQMLGLGIADEPMESVATAPSTSSSSPSEPAPIPLDENGNPIIKIDRNKLTQALSGIYKAKGITPSTTSADKDDDDEMPFPKPNEATGSRPQEPPPLTSPIESPTQSGGTLSFEEEIMAMQMQGGDIDAFISNKDTSHHEKASDAQQTATPTPISTDYDIDALAREIMSAQLPKVVETNDPTPIAEQQQPFSDDDIKTPTRQLAKIFEGQGAYTKAIKVYEMLSEREPENASLYDILISALREKINTPT